jgi:hypothetical protein
VTVRTYPDARHEILNETNRDEIIAELITWIDRVTAAAGQDGRQDHGAAHAVVAFPRLIRHFGHVLSLSVRCGPVVRTVRSGAGRGH